MTTSVYEYTLELLDSTIIDLPVQAKILSVAFQGEQLCLWAEVDPSYDLKESRHIEVFDTGHPMPYYRYYERQFISTVFTGQLVFHVFEKVENKDIDRGEIL